MRLNVSSASVRTAALALALLVAVAGCGDDDPIGPALNPFLGTWNVVDVDASPISGTWVFGVATMQIDYGTTFTGTYRYDETASPAQIDLMIDGEPTAAGIYRFVGALLTIKVADGAASRATDFTIEAGYDLFTFNRSP